MSHKLVNHSPDLKRLSADGYELEIRGTHALVHHVPYVNASKQVKYGTLVSALSLSTPNKTDKPNTHVIHFFGEHPCDRDGREITAIKHQSQNQTLDEKLKIAVNHSFSNKPANGFNDYYEKFTSYIRIISSPAESIDENAKAITSKVIESIDPDDVFKYMDTNSSRAEINVISAKLENLKIAIIGLGGTGSYVLDFIAKTPVREIHLFDEDTFMLHNAFRAPGAAHANQFESQPKKVAYLHAIYSNMHKYIIPHEQHLDASNFSQLSGMSFAFVCIDKSEHKEAIIGSLLSLGVPFVDVGMGLEAIDGALRGIVRSTTGTEKKHDHLKDRISFGKNPNDDYSHNIQIAELNALNAAFAVIKWKKYFGFYHDQGKEFHMAYSVSTNEIVNDETTT